ncbi:MAG: hypothetical protein IKX20_03915 [Paludibacteraceae bacterium]|nr:hypothetical protein [Paludibacteraceae bacterium]
MLNNFEDTLIGTFASSVISTSAIQSLLPHLQEKQDDPLLSKDEYKNGYLAGYIEGFLLGYFQAKIEIAGRLKKAHINKDFIAEVTELNEAIIDQLL